MAWLKIDDGFDEHRKIENLSDRAFRLHVAGLCRCARGLTDGLLSETTVRGLSARCKATRRHVQELVDAELWNEYPGHGFVVTNYLEWNPSKQVVEERREKRKEAGQLGGLRSGEARREASASANGSANMKLVG